MANNYTTTSLEALKYICSVINKTVDLPSTVISDTSVATNTTYSSVMLNKVFNTLEDELKNYTDTAIAGLNKLTKEIINDRALVVKDNVLYLYKAADDPSNDYMQMMLINGVAVELGCTQVDMSDYYNKQDSDNKFAAKLDLDTLTTSFNDLVDKVSAIEDEIGTEALTTTSQTVKGAINEVADKSEIVTLTKAEYEALTPKDAETYYITSDDMTMYKGESKVLGGNGKSLVGKETVLYEGNITATGTYTLADDVNDYDFIVINYTHNSISNYQSIVLNKVEISKCTSESHRFICVYGYASEGGFSTGYFNNNKVIISNYNAEVITSITGYKFGRVTVENTIANPSPAASYSTDEQLTGGTWIDGKPIYRKVFDYSSNLWSSGDKDVSNLNIKQITSSYFIGCDNSDGNGNQWAQSTTGNSDRILYFDVNYSVMKRSGGYYYKYVILEYTKTTD